MIQILLIRVDLPSVYEQLRKYFTVVYTFSHVRPELFLSHVVVHIVRPYLPP